MLADTLDLMDIYLLILAGVVGLLFGSFLNCVAMRIVRGENWVSGRSRCLKCGHELSARDLVPVASFLTTRGRCRYCGERISRRYPATELVFAAVSVALFLRFGISVELVRYFVLACCLFVLTLTDIEERIIPNGTLVAAVIGYFATEPWLFAGWKQLGAHVAAMVGFAVAILCLSLIMDEILKKESLGGGDVKLIGVLGLYLGVVAMMFMLIGACVLGILYAALVRKLKRGQVIAFGPFLSMAGFLMALYGAPLVNWYVGFLF